MGVFSRIIGLSQFASPLGLIGKIANKQKITSIPNTESLKKGLTISAAGAGTVATGGLLSEQLQKDQNEKKDKMGLLDKLKEWGIDPTKEKKPNVTGGFQFGSQASSGFIPILIAGAVAVAIAVGGGFFSFGKKSKRRRR